jgi:hypothetical protein
LAPGSGPSATILAGEGGYSSVPELGDAVILSTYTENSVVSCEPELFDCNTNDVPDLCDIVYMSSTDIDDNDQPDDCQPRVVVAVSRKSHGGAGEFDVDATSGDSEPRAAGVTRLIVTFDQEVFAVGGPSTDDVSVSHGMVTSVDQLGTDLLEVLMTMGGADKVCLLVDFPGIENIDGFQVADMLQVPVIQGDINNDGLSGVADATSANATGAVTDDAEARGDLDLDGFRGPSDEAAAKIASSPIATACP